MGVDLTGKGFSHENDAETKKQVDVYIPPDEVLEKPPQEKKKVEEKKEVIEEEYIPAVDLAENARKRKKLLRIGMIVLVSILVVGGGAVGGYLFITQQSEQVIISPPVTQPPQPTAPPTVPQPSQPPVTQPTGPLPDTPLAPLYGALVKFSGESVVYLIENNGELRMITEGVIFDNGQTLTTIRQSLIYTIGDQWKEVRKGRDVMGRVDFDPRVLTLPELRPYL